MVEVVDGKMIIGPNPSTHKYTFKAGKFGWLGPVPRTLEEDIALVALCGRAKLAGSRIDAVYMTEYLGLSESDYEEEE